MHYYKKNIGDYAKKAGRLTMLQHGAYTLLLDSCYDREQFPTLDEAIEWTWASSKEEIEAVEFVLRKFFLLEDGKYTQNRIKEELAKYHSNAETNKRIAIERESKRKSNSTKREQTVDDSLPNHKPLTNNQITNNLSTPKPPKGVDVRFEKFWLAYPKKVGKFDARRAFERRKVTDELLEQMLKAVSKQSASDAWRKDGGQFIPNPSTWLNQGRWEDEGVSFQSTPTEIKGRDPVLLKLEEDAKKATAPPPEVLAKMKALRRTS